MIPTALSSDLSAVIPAGEPGPGRIAVAVLPSRSRIGLPAVRDDGQRG